MQLAAFLGPLAFQSVYHWNPSYVEIKNIYNIESKPSLVTEQ